jgi:hypothetical protein
MHAVSLNHHGGQVAQADDEAAEENHLPAVASKQVASELQSHVFPQSQLATQARQQPVADPPSHEITQLIVGAPSDNRDEQDDVQAIRGCVADRRRL